MPLSSERPPISGPTRRLAVVGAGPVGLAFACAAAPALPGWSLHVFDAQALDGLARPDARTLALSLGSIQWLRRLQAWPAHAAEPMTEVSVSQALPGRTDLRLRASELGVNELGAVLPYSAVLQALQRRWLALADAAPQRLFSHGGTRVAACKPLPDGRVELDAGIAEAFDLVLIAEGGLFTEQTAQPWRREYAQTAWVGQVQLGAAWPRGLAVERFTRDGPLAVLPLPDQGAQRRAALVWCLPPGDDLAALSPERQRARLHALLPACVQGHGAVGELEGPLRPFALGLNADPSPLKGRCVRLGNAAQTLHPVAGQGLNLGLRDAHELVVQLRDGSADLDGALQRWQRRRRPDRLALLATTDLLARAFTWDVAPVTVARELGLRALQALPPLRRALARGLMFGWH